jgi:hypothetical protein
MASVKYRVKGKKETASIYIRLLDGKLTDTDEMRTDDLKRETKENRKEQPTGQQKTFANL